jgi:hypothetical protein
MDAWLLWFNASFWTWLFDLVPWIQARANDTESWANQASQSATTAGLTANALVWNPSTNYALGQNAISPTNFQTYRRRVAGVSATDPVSDATNWTAVAAVPDDSVTFAKMQNIATAVILGRSTAGTGDVEALTGAQATALLSAASETVSGRVELADAAEAAAGTDATRALSPARLRDAVNATGTAPIFACRAWVNFDGTGTVAIRGSGNVSSITDNGTGNYTVNMTTAMPDANYVAMVTVSNSNSAPYVTSGNQFTPQTTTAFRVTITSGTLGVDNSAPFTDLPNVHVSVFR